MKNLTEQAIEIILKTLPDVVGIYCFGSLGSKYETQASDMDLAVLHTNKLSSHVQWDLSQAIAYVVKKDVDLIDLLAASTVLRFQVISTGQRVYCRDIKVCELFEMYVYSSYVRFNDERREILESIKKTGRIYRG